MFGRFCDWLTLMTNTVISLAFSGCGNSSRTHLTEALIFASRSTRCAVANMMLTELAASTLIGLIGSWGSAFEGLKGKKLQNLEGRFDGSE